MLRHLALMAIQPTIHIWYTVLDERKEKIEGISMIRDIWVPPGISVEIFALRSNAI
jgi:hypothetical protein